MNDWDIKKFIKMVLALQLALFCLIGIDAAGFHIPILGQLIGFIYLTFIPGLLVLRALNLHRLGRIETLLYSVGLSIGLLMFTGFMANRVLPPLGILQPISIMPLTVIISCIVLFLCIICYLADRKKTDMGQMESFIDVGDTISPQALFLYTLPFLAILGAYVQNHYGNNMLLILTILVIIAIVLMIGFDRFIPKKLFPLAVISIAIALLFQDSLITMHLVGYDIQKEYNLTIAILHSGIWDQTLFYVLNSMLSVMMLAPIYSIILNLDVVWVFKIIYPLLFSLVPLCLYRVFQKQTNEKIAFMAVFFFMSMIGFYVDMIQLARQEIAEIFLALILLLLVDSVMGRSRWFGLLVVFLFGLSLSHYGLTYIFMALLIAMLFVLSFIKKAFRSFLNDRDIQIGNMPAYGVLAFVVFTLIWYLYTSQSDTWSDILKIILVVENSIFNEFLSVDTVQGLAIIQSAGTPLYNAFKDLHMFAQVCIVIGVLAIIVGILLRSRKVKFSVEFMIFAVLNVALLAASVTIPYIASALQTSRLYHISLIFLAPFFVIGWQTVFFIPKSVHRNGVTSWIANNSMRALALFLALYLVFNSGLIFILLNDSTPISLSLNTSIDLPEFNEKEVAGAQWMAGMRGYEEIGGAPMPIPIYSDYYRFLLMTGYDLHAQPISDEYNGIPGSIKIPDDCYLYSGTLNILKDKAMVISTEGGLSQKLYVNYSDFIEGRGRIYSNGGAEVYSRSW